MFPKTNASDVERIFNGKKFEGVFMGFISEMEKIERVKTILKNRFGSVRSVRFPETFLGAERICLLIPSKSWGDKDCKLLDEMESA